ncbi:hypothetical protein HAX54_028079 [Datura stramonium]|uniref:Uncharacterized protein n=1 Tax=Datura stramonium TaxID=4076 RepID=A0ABS8V4Z4_DATST|nr:hypothetical protein [Datura stramonium]
MSDAVQLTMHNCLANLKFKACVCAIDCLLRHSPSLGAKPAHQSPSIGAKPVRQSPSLCTKPARQVFPTLPSCACLSRTITVIGTLPFFDMSWRQCPMPYFLSNANLRFHALSWIINPMPSWHCHAIPHQVLTKLPCHTQDLGPHLPH